MEVWVWMLTLSQLRKENISINGYLEITLIVSNTRKVKKTCDIFRGIPDKVKENFIFELEDEVFNVCKTFSLNNKNRKNLIDELKKIVENL